MQDGGSVHVCNQISFMFEKALGVLRTGGARQEAGSQEILAKMLVAWTREWRHWGGRTDGIRRVNCIWDPCS